VIYVDGLPLPTALVGRGARRLLRRARPWRSASYWATANRIIAKGRLVRDVPRVFTIGLGGRIIGAGRLSHLLQCVAYCVAE
jgi:hypothetical protein